MDALSIVLSVDCHSFVLGTQCGQVIILNDGSSSSTEKAEAVHHGCLTWRATPTLAEGIGRKIHVTYLQWTFHKTITVFSKKSQQSSFRTSFSKECRNDMLGRACLLQQEQDQTT